MDVENKVVAIVGPNEAGKSSLLKALTSLNSDRPFEQGAVPELTRGATPSKEQDIVWALFHLNEDDQVSLSDIPIEQIPRWLKLCKRADGKRHLEFKPEIRRDKKHRLSIAEKIRKTHKLNQGVTEIPSEIEILESDKVDYSDKELNSLKNLIGVLKDWAEGWRNLSSLVGNLPEELELLIDSESQQSLHDKARELILPQVSVFRLFTPEERELASSYDIAKLDIKKVSALKNLAEMAGLDLSNLKGADIHTRSTLTDNANDQLRKAFEAWRQSDFTVKFNVPGNTLIVEVKDEKTKVNTSVRERSEGLLWFVLLVAFVNPQAQERDSNIILLVDEAEQHLHYDAQADLVQMFMRQIVVPKIIYTTHSAGCLPEDLGRSVKVIKTESETSRSKIVNQVWRNEELGFQPLLLGMGASTFALTAARHAVFAEGIADFIVLPSMLRKSLNVSSLGFQVLPGISEVKPEQVTLLTLSAVHKVFLYDNDRGGRRHRRKLCRLGIPEEFIMPLPIEEASLEDFINPQLYVTAVNSELEKSHGTVYEFQLENEVTLQRPQILKNWCEQQGIEEPGKRAVMERVLEYHGLSNIEQDENIPLIDSGRKDAFNQLANNLVEKLKLVKIV